MERRGSNSIAEAACGARLPWPIANLPRSRQVLAFADDIFLLASEENYGASCLQGQIGHYSLFAACSERLHGVANLMNDRLVGSHRYPIPISGQDYMHESSREKMCMT